MNYNHASIAELESAEDLSWEQVYEILHARAQRPDSRSARRAAAWCAAHPEYASERKASAPAKATPAPKPARKTGPGSRGGDPAKAARADYARTHNANGRKLRAGKENTAGTSAWWKAYRSEQAKAVEESARKVLASA